MRITSEIIEKTKDRAGELLDSYIAEIQTAIDNEGEVSIGLPIKIKLNGERFDVQIGISFVKSRIKDNITFSLTDQQIEMFEDKD